MANIRRGYHRGKVEGARALSNHGHHEGDHDQKRIAGG
jgi:hypothetical protein